MRSMEAGRTASGMDGIPQKPPMESAVPQDNGKRILALLAFEEEPGHEEYAQSQAWRSIFCDVAQAGDTATLNDDASTVVNPEEFFDALASHDDHDEDGRLILTVSELGMLEGTFPLDRKEAASTPSRAVALTHTIANTSKRLQSLLGIRGGDQNNDNNKSSQYEPRTPQDGCTDGRRIPPSTPALSSAVPPPPPPPPPPGDESQQCPTNRNNAPHIPPPPSAPLPNGDPVQYSARPDPDDPFAPLPAPPPPKELPLRFLRAGKGDPIEGQRRYEATLEWRRQNAMDSILQTAHPNFDLIKQHYPHYFHLRSRNGQPVYYELPPKTNLAALRRAGIDLPKLLRHYAMITEFQWQHIERDDLARSITVIDLEGIRMMDFVGDCVEYVKKCSAFTGQHYPERAGCVLVINVPKWFKVIWNVVKPMVDEVTLQKIRILRGKEEIYQELLNQIPVENIPPEYGGQSMPLGQSPQEHLLRDLMEHNGRLAQGDRSCGGRDAGCRFCSFRYARSY